MNMNKPISVELCSRAVGSQLGSSLVENIISIQRGWRADRSTANPQDGFLATEFAEREVDAIYQDGGNFFILCRGSAVLGFALTTGIDKFTDQFGPSSTGQLVVSESLNLAEFVYLYQVAILKGEQQRGLGRQLVQHVQRYHEQPVLADVLSAPVPNVGSRIFFERLGFRKVGVLELDNYRDYGSLTSDVLVD